MKILLTMSLAAALITTIALPGLAADQVRGYIEVVDAKTNTVKLVGVKDVFKLSKDTKLMRWGKAITFSDLEVKDEILIIHENLLVKEIEVLAKEAPWQRER